MCSAKGHVRFTPNSDRKSRHVTNGHVRFTPESGHAAQQSMSAKGHKRTFRHSFDYFVSRRKQVRRYCEIESLGGLHVYDKIEFSWLQDRQFRDFCAPENSPAVNANLMVHPGDACAVAHQSASGYELFVKIDHRDGMLGRRCCDGSALAEQHRVARDHGRVGALRLHSSECGIEVALISRVHDYRLPTKLACRFLSVL